MKSGYVIGVMHKRDHVSVVVHCDDDPCFREMIIRICISDKAKAIRAGDHVWTQSNWAVWSSSELGVSDVKLNLHRTLWNGDHPCCNAPPSDGEEAIA